MWQQRKIFDDAFVFHSFISARLRLLWSRVESHSRESLVDSLDTIVCEVET